MASSSSSGDILDAKADDVEGAYNLVALNRSAAAPPAEDGYDSQATIDERTGRPVGQGRRRRGTRRSRKSKRQSRGRRTAGRRKASRGRR